MLENAVNKFKGMFSKNNDHVDNKLLSLLMAEKCRTEIERDIKSKIISYVEKHGDHEYTRIVNKTVDGGYQTILFDVTDGVKVIAFNSYENVDNYDRKIVYWIGK